MLQRFRENDVSLLFVSVYFRFNFATCSVYACKCTQYLVFVNSDHPIFCVCAMLKNVTLLNMTDLDIKNLRTKLGITQKQLAEMVGVSVNTIQNWESGGTIPKSKHPILGSIIASPHVVYGGQHVQHGDAVNGDKIVQEVADVKETVEEVRKQDVSIRKVVTCEADRLLTLLEANQRSLDALIAQQARYLTIIENLSNPKV